MNKGSPIYPRHRLHTLEPYYSRHIGAMTELPGIQEGLHSKSDIAEQLAWRDQAIDRLVAEVARLKFELGKAQSEISGAASASGGDDLTGKQ